MKYYFWILGCAMNYSDAERISAVLDSLSYEKTENEKEADLFIVISCSVRQSAINRIYGKVKDLKDRKTINKKLITMLTGCVLEKDRKKLEKVFDILFEIKDLHRLPELLSSVIPSGTRDPGLDSFRQRTDRRSPQNDNGGGKSSDYLSVQPHYDSTFRAYVPISTGCDNFCTYCAVPYTRGREKSRPVEEIVTEVRNLVEKGYKEITLLGQNVNSYGKAISDRRSAKNERETSKRQMTNDEEPFISLLRNIDEINGDFRVYFYSNHPKDMSDELIDILPTLKHFPHYIHLPLQSGNDEIIRKMNRHYTKEKYFNLVKKIRKAMPDVTLTTDIIVGFPTETDEQFADTIEVMEKVKFDMAFIAQYSPRPGTISAKMPDDVTKEEKKDRDKKLNEILAKTVLENNQKLIGTTQKVLIDEEKNGKFYGRTEGFKVVEISCQSTANNQQNKTDLIGRLIDIKIEKVSSWKLFATK